MNIQTPFGQNMLGSSGEGYGLCDQNIQSGGRDYVDYGVSDTGNWNNAVVLSHSSTSVKIARTTGDGNWTLTQTITLVPKTYSITVVMALKNNQTVVRGNVFMILTGGNSANEKHPNGSGDLYECHRVLLVR